MPNVLSPRDLVFRPDNMDETVPYTRHVLGQRCVVRYILWPRHVIRHFMKRAADLSFVF